MTVTRHRVWTQAEADVKVTLLDGSGNPTDTAVIFCYGEGFALDGDLEFSRRPVFARKVKKIVNREYTWKLSIDALYFSSKQEIEPIIGSRHKLLVELIFGEGSDTETIQLLNANFATIHIGGSDAKPVAYNCSFEAEDINWP